MDKQAAGRRITVEVAYALPQEQVLKELQVPEGTTVGEVVEQSGLLELYPEIDLDRNGVGIFGKVTKPDATVREQDRVEIYRPLIADPKEVRRKRAAAGKKMKKGA